MSKLVTVRIEFTIEVEDEIMREFSYDNDINQLDEVIDQFISDNADILEYDVIQVQNFAEGE